MSLTRALLVATAVLVYPTTSSAQDTGAPALPTPIAKALDVFLREGSAAGVRALTPSWSSGDDRSKQDQLIETFGSLEPIAGRMKGFDLVRSLSISPHLQRHYIVLLYDKQPVYLMLGVYQPPAGEWIVITLNFHTDSKQVFPTTLLEPERPDAKP